MWDTRPKYRSRGRGRRSNFFPYNRRIFHPSSYLAIFTKETSTDTSAKKCTRCRGCGNLSLFSNSFVLGFPFFSLFFFFFIVVLDARGKVQDSSSRQSFDGIGNVGRKILGFLSSLNERD